MASEEIRLSKAEPCGVIRDGHQMTMVRLTDIQNVIGSLQYYRDRAKALDEKNAISERECRERGEEIANLKKGIANASAMLERTACGIT